MHGLLKQPVWLLWTASPVFVAFSIAYDLHHASAQAASRADSRKKGAGSTSQDWDLPHLPWFFASYLLHFALKAGLSQSLLAIHSTKHKVVWTCQHRGYTLYSKPLTHWLSQSLQSQQRQENKRLGQQQLPETWTDNERQCTKVPHQSNSEVCFPPPVQEFVFTHDST